MYRVFAQQLYLQGCPQTTSNQRMGNLLSVPIHRLMDGLSAATAENLRRTYVLRHFDPSTCYKNDFLVTRILNLKRPIRM